ncbi:aminotransferase class I/II-fold pyridoxal phosphate-dependent enzyme [Jatrophihabitans fulvus]
MTAPRDEDAPLLAAWVQAMALPWRPFTIPGHKRRAEQVWPSLGALLRDDVPLFGGLDTVKAAPALLERAERLAAEAWGADWCRFVTGGATQANQALLLALGRPGDTVLVSRSAHRSAVSGLVLAGLRPVWVAADVDPVTGLPSGLSLPSLRAALDDNPDAVGLVCVEPSYVGTVGELSAAVELCHGRGVPVVVDQAWGAHFGFADDYPPHALQAGADAMVISTHKTLAGYSQAAVALARTARLDPVALDRSVDALITTSPAGPLLAGSDASRALLTSPLGRSLLDGLRRSVAAARDALALDGVAPLQPTARFDPAKLVLQLDGVDGLAVERDLLAAGLPLEQADRDTLVPVVTMFDGADDVAALVAELTASLARRADGRRSSARFWDPPAPVTALDPREAFFAAHELVPRAEAIGRIGAETIAPYPPGIPVLAPGETVTAEVMDFLADARAAGTRIAYAADPTLEHVRVVRRG